MTWRFEPRSIASTKLLWLLVGLLPTQTSACDRSSESSPSREVIRDAAVGTVPEEPLRPYPPSRARLASFRELDSVLLWVSHIVVAHSKSTSRASQLRPMDWNPDKPYPKRSRAEALARVRRLQRKLESGAPFDELAREYSDDPVTRSRGGRLGGVAATHMPTEYLDALAAIGLDTASEAFETEWGFHLVLRHPTPDDDALSAQRVLIRYAGTWPEPHRLASGRSRSEALALAKQLSDDARAGEYPFEDIVAKHSEGYARRAEGDIGTWRLHEHPLTFGTQLDELSMLEIGEVTRPIDTPGGFAVLRRTRPRVRQELAMQAIRISYDVRAPEGDPKHRDEANKTARALALRLRHSPGAFPSLVAEHCCKSIKRWSAGRWDARLTRAVASLEVGETSADPVETAGRFWVPRRVDVQEAPEKRAMRFELPSPRRPRVEALIKKNSGKALAAQTRLLASGVIPRLRVDDEERRAVTEQFERLASEFERAENAEGRITAWRQSLARIEGVLGKAKFVELRALVDESIARTIMGF